MSQTYPLDLPSLQVLVASVDITAFVLARTLVTHAVLGPQIDSCSFALKAPESYRAGSLTKPTVGQSVQINIKTSPTASYTLVYSGLISRVGEVKIAYKTVRWNIECVDNTHLLTRLLVVQNYQDQLVSDIVLDIARKYCGGIDTSGVQTTHGNTVQSITFSYKTPLDCFEELAGLVGYQWFIDPSNVLYFYDPSSTLRVSTQSITDTSNNFDELTIEPQLDQVRNRVYVTGGVGLSSTVTETFDCDGRLGSDPPFTLARRGIVSNQIGMTVDGKRGNFMTLSGANYGGAAVNQLTAVANVADQYQLPSGWLVDVDNGVVMRGLYTPIPPDGTTATFRYQFKTPVNVVQQNTASMQAVAALDGSDWITTVSGDNPMYWWRLNETSGTAATNRGYAGVQWSGMYNDSYTQNVTGPVVYDPTSRAVDFTGGKIIMVSGTQLPCNYTIEALVQAPFPPSNKVIWAFADPAPTGLTAEYLGFSAPTGAYILAHRDGIAQDDYIYTYGVTPVLGRFDHVVARYFAGSGSIYINNVLRGGPTAAGIWGTTNMRFSIADTAETQGGISPGVYARLAEVVVFSGGLSTTQIAEHYFAFKYGGVREHALTVNGETSYDACMQKANAELDKYSAVITKLTWNSFVPIWQAGDTVTINVTSANLGRTFSGTALIQEVLMRWLGTQRFQYEVMCTSVRYNPIDHARALAAPRDPIVPNSTVAGLVLMTTFTEDDAILIDGPVTHTIA